MVKYSKLLLAAFVNTAVALLVIRIVRASEPVEWTAKPGDGPKSFVRHHGSTLEFRCAFAGFGGAFAESSDVRLWYQTNGMGRAWWSVPATRSNDVLSASWPPSADPGADRVSFFFGAPSNAYASAVVRLQHSPGFTPNVVSAPVQTIDFSKVDVANAPWIRPDDSALEVMRESIGQKQNALTVDQLSTLNGGPYVSATSGYDNTEIPYNPIAFLGLFRGATLHGGRGGRSIYLAYKPSVSGYNAPLFGLGIMTLEDSLIPGSVITNFSAFASSVDVATHIADAENPHNVTANQVGAYPRQDSISFFDGDGSGDTSRPRILVCDPSNAPFDLAGIFYGGQIFGIRGEMRDVAETISFRLDWPWGWTGTIATSNMVENVVATIPSTYAATNAIVSVNCSVQAVVDPPNNTLPTFLVPAAVPGGVRDWIVHVVSSGQTDITVTGFPATVDGDKTANFFSPIAAADLTKACTHGTVTTFTFTEINSTATAVNFMVMRAELQRVNE